MKTINMMIKGKEKNAKEVLIKSFDEGTDYDDDALVVCQAFENYFRKNFNEYSAHMKALRKVSESYREYFTTVETVDLNNTRINSKNMRLRFLYRFLVEYAKSDLPVSEIVKTNICIQ